MARDTGPRCKRARRVGSDLELFSGVRPLDSKCKLTVPPGMHGAKRARLSDYSRSLRAKQALRWKYGVQESQFRRYYQEAVRQRGITGFNLLKLLEARLDNVVFRMGFAATRAEARQLVLHRSVLVDTRIVNIPSYQVKPGQIIAIKEKSKAQTRIQAAIELAKQKSQFDWITVDDAKLEGTFKSYPERDDLPPELNEDLVVGYYSK